MPVSVAMKAHLAGTLTVAVFLTVTAKDGDVLRITNCTRPKLVDGEVYTPVMFTPSRLQATNGLKPDNLEAMTVLGGLFTEATLLKRKWLGARIEYRVLNWKDFSMGPADRRVGFLGMTDVGRYTAKPEFLSLSSKLGEQVGPSYQAGCDVVELGDTRCGFDLDGETADGYTATIPATVTAVLNRQQIVVEFDDWLVPSDHGVLIAPDKFYERGTATFTSGLNNEAIARIYSSTGNGISFWLPAFYNIAVNDTLTLVVGCNRSIEQCVARFANGERNRSFYMLPGRSRLLKIPE